MAKKKKAPSGPKVRIDHSVFGLGTIVEANAYHTTIAFDEETGTRKFVTQMVQLEHSDVPAPDKPRRKKAVRRTKKVAEPAGDSPAA